MSLLAAAIFAATAVASVRTPRVEVGDPVDVTVKVTARPGAMITLTPPASSPPLWEVDASGEPRMRPADLDGNATFTYRVIPYSPEPFRLPPATVEVAGTAILQSDPIALSPFNPLGRSAKDAPPPPIRSIRPFPRSDGPLWVWVAVGAFLGTAAWLLTRPKKTAAPPLAPPELAVLRASGLPELMEAVQRIAADPPRERRAIQEAHFTIAEAVRRFVEERWEVPASRQTTEEFLAGIARSSRFRGGGMSFLPVVLEACDRVKWAGTPVSPQDTLEVARLTLDFFQASRGA